MLKSSENGMEIKVVVDPSGFSFKHNVYSNGNQCHRYPLPPWRHWKMYLSCRFWPKKFKDML
jgi:hypothetical protein